MRSLNIPQNQTQTTFDWSSLSDFYTQATPYFPVAIAGAIVWGLWLYRFILSHRARPYVTDFEATTSVIVPSFHEDPDILMSALESWRQQRPTERFPQAHPVREMACSGRRLHPAERLLLDR